MFKNLSLFLVKKKKGLRGGDKEKAGQTPAKTPPGRSKTY